MTSSLTYRLQTTGRALILLNGMSVGVLSFVKLKERVVQAVFIFHFFPAPPWRASPFCLPEPGSGQARPARHERCCCSRRTKPIILIFFFFFIIFDIFDFLLIFYLLITENIFSGQARASVATEQAHQATLIIVSFLFIPLQIQNS